MFVKCPLTTCSRLFLSLHVNSFVHYSFVDVLIKMKQRKSLFLSLYLSLYLSMSFSAGHMEDVTTNCKIDTSWLSYLQSDVLENRSSALCSKTVARGHCQKRQTRQIFHILQLLTTISHHKPPIRAL